MVVEVLRPSVGKALDRYIGEARFMGVKEVILATDSEGKHTLYSLLDDSKFVPDQSARLIRRMKVDEEWLMDAVPGGFQAVVTINPPSLAIMQRIWRDTGVKERRLYPSGF